MNQEAIQRQLERLLASPQFAQSGRLSRFLRLVVEETARGNGASLKEYRIGVEVFDRGRDFDPRIDPIVRVQATKLRAKLLEYYTGAGARDPVLIAVPKGTYAPDIQPRGATEAPTAPPPAGRSRIAVLPLANTSGDPENEHFSDGLTEELINRLARVPGLQVVARTSVFRFKGIHEDVREIGARLNVGVVLEGSVRRSRKQVRVSAQLVDVESGYQLFAKTYQREYKDIFQLQDELAQAVVSEIVPERSDAPRFATPALGSLEAYNAYLRGMFAVANRFANLHQSVAHFKEALAIEPRFAPAWAGLAHAYWVMAWFHMMPATQALPLSREAALRTLEIDPDSGLAHASLGIIESGLEWRWESAVIRFKRAIQLQPGLAIIYPFYAVICLMPQKRLDEACAAVSRGLELDPFNPLFHAMATLVYAVSGRDAEAIRQHALGLEAAPRFPPILAAGGLAYELAGRMDEAIANYQMAVDLAGDLPVALSMLAHALAVSGQADEARQILRRLMALPRELDLDLARVHLGLRDADETFRWLHLAVERRNIHLLTLTTDKRYDWLRADPRFGRILEQMSLAG